LPCVSDSRFAGFGRSPVSCLRAAARSRARLSRRRRAGRAARGATNSRRGRINGKPETHWSLERIKALTVLDLAVGRRLTEQRVLTRTLGLKVEWGDGGRNSYGGNRRGLIIYKNDYLQLRPSSRLHGRHKKSCCLLQLRESGRELCGSKKLLIAKTRVSRKARMPMNLRVPGAEILGRRRDLLQLHLLSCS
jgi:hypothetical protein